MTTKVRWSSMPRVSIVQDEENSKENENGSEESDGSLSADDNDAADCRKKGPNHGTNGCANESGRIPLTAYLRGPYPTFSLVPVDTEKFLWERFQQYSWTKNKDNEIYFVWLERRQWKIHEKLGKPPTASQLFECVHRRNMGEGDFVDNKLRFVWEKYDIAIHEKYDSNVSQPEINIETWREAIPGPCKGGRLYALGIQRKSLHEDITSSGLPNVPYDGQVDFITLQEEFRST
ncbi:Hypothetical predicted protein [Olea europaea subsp. europaea]|uniref:Uncharacterized protein n=1 Tax=Olea europaea subsp. europaea TaxID=158383 RepID=A0A8S0QIR0_OLEEU|nr:Hypothetical predicted protein [Olea europaea subsp. europaea]